MATRMYVCESAEHPANLLLGLNEQRLQGQLCDVTVRVQGHLFKAHTNVLASAMGYFRDLFLNPNKQVKKEIIEIPMIVNSIGFAKVLDFIYTSQLCLSQSSVMQVLCSACYLQIPYVVDKCQEFIVTHGHVSPHSASLPTCPDQRYLLYNNSKGSENPACDLINTPPSPGNHSASNSAPGEEHHASSPAANEEPHDLSPHGSMGGKNDHNEQNSAYGVMDPTMSNEANPASMALMEYSNRTRMNLMNDSNAHRNGTLKILLQNGEGQGTDGETIDHDSLAEYFASRSGHNAIENNPTFAISSTDTSTPSTAIEQHLYSMTKSISSQKNGVKEPQAPAINGNPVKDMTSSPTSSVSQYLLSMKKEKPKKEYRCEYCNKMFGRQQHLKRHILTHTGERPYPCHLCEKRFRRSEHLKHHLVKHQQDSNVPSGPGSVAGLTSYTGTRKRKTVPADAYSMSKMMLVSSYNQPKQEEQSPKSDSKNLEKDLIGSNPILITKLNGGSALDSISERLAFAAAQRSEQDQDAYRNVADSSMALNLSSKLQSTTELFDATQQHSSNEDNQRVDEEMQKSPVKIKTEHNEMNMMAENDNAGDAGNDKADNVNSGAVEDATNEDVKGSPHTQQESNSACMSMDNFGSSEVVTPDLKRLFAAMDG